MLYFIPAWYQENQWSEREQYWYERRTKSEFDETIKQITLFHRNVRTGYCILSLAFSPNLRHFLHRQGMYRSTYWSCFDAICQIKRTKTAVLSYMDIKWPEGVEFAYSPFAVVAYMKGQKYAQVEFGEDGNPISIDMYQDNQIIRRNYYDDRGFVSGSIVYEQGLPQYQDYLTMQGIWKLRCFMSDGHVELNPSFPDYDITVDGETKEIAFQKIYYDSLGEVIAEVLTSYLRHTHADDKFFVAAHPLHIHLLEDCLQGRRVVTTFFENRFDYSRIGDIRDFLEKSDYVITDSRQTTAIIEERLGEDSLNITDIPPYDTRMDFGISSQLKVQNILIPIDGIGKDDYRQIILEAAHYMTANELARVHIFTREAAWGREEKLTNELADILEQAGYDRRWAKREKPRLMAENKIDEDEEDVDQRFFIDTCVDERTISKCINEQRVILDLRQIVDVYVDITAISKGVPRISLSEDQFFEHKKNGYLIHDFSQIGESLNFYLDSFENWNEALVQCYKIGHKYTTGVLLGAWRKVLGISE